MENTFLMNLMLPTVNTDSGIRLDVCVKAKRPKALTVASGLSPSDWGQEVSQRQSLVSAVIAMATKVVIGGATDGDCYGSHVMDG